ncbi:UNVERIFIED_CONTAM: Kinesin-like protein KIN-7F [Sesamum radiatum]|uniref:Kinesin-like protein n=1 Tax=Sesamum radiatum TaxID=300843 RepID=A0AAW2SHG8_SESRA
MGSVSGESWVWDGQDSSPREEKIFVSVRLRPLNERELSKNDIPEWECINNTTIIFKNGLHERSLSPAAYTFDRVFGPQSPTRQVYEEAAKKIALSVLSGMNSSIFAYGQTSSGKTYTMSGITGYAVEDIYDYISKHPERAFVLKFSAMEIYNEVVKDLLSFDGTPLRLLDDPVRGTVVEKLTEVTLRRYSHLKELLSICEAQRKIGETTLNEMSSRSHQILCLTVESEARKYCSAENSSALTATVNFVDLAGSERASQTSSAGMRLKEGCHINRSLLTLGTVIRKLSKGRNGHIPYRDSKLTRILQHSLGGNARTAVICTMSPAHSHAEQSRSTLVFASCAKQVSTSAKVNVVMSEKALVKQLRREITRMENELRNLNSIATSCDTASALKEKELLIEKLDKEIRQLIHQRDIARSRLEDMLLSGGSFGSPKSWMDWQSLEKGSQTDEYASSEASEIVDPFYSDVSSRASHFSDRYDDVSSSRTEHQSPRNYTDQFLSDDTSPTLYIDKYFGPESPDPGWEKIAQVAGNKLEGTRMAVQCIELDLTKTNMVASASSPDTGEKNSGISHCPLENSPASNVAKEDEETSQNKADNQGKLPSVEPEANSENLHAEDSNSPIRIDFANEKEENINTSVEDCNIEQQELAEVNEVIEPQVVTQREDDLELCQQDAEVRGISDNQETKTDSGSNNDPDKVLSASDNQETKTDGGFNEDQDTAQSASDNQETKTDGGSNDDQDTREIKTDGGSNDDQDAREIKTDGGSNEDQDTTQHASDNQETKTDGGSNKDQDTTQSDSDNQETKTDGGSNKDQDTTQSASDWSTQFERQRQEILDLWNTCNVPLVYRTYFFLLFKGDPSEAVYMEVELRRLSFLKKKLDQSTVARDDQVLTETSSAKALNREREMLSRQMYKKFSGKERDALYEKWGIDLKTKQRRLQLCRLLWTDPKNMDHIKESAALVAKLVGLKELERAPKEMIGLSLLQEPQNLSCFSWMPSLI